MNREILYRGKRKSNGKWIGGFYQKRYDDFENIQHLIFWAKSSIVWEYAEVDPETVCQYIGLTDKKGGKIFDGDIVKQFADCTESGESLHFFYVIEWDEEYCAFVGREIHSDEAYLMPDLEDIEVVGNVYENSDLLKEVEE